MLSANLYALRVNLSVAIVAMTSNYTVFVNGSSIQVTSANVVSLVLCNETEL